MRDKAVGKQVLLLYFGFRYWKGSETYRLVCVMYPLHVYSTYSADTQRVQYICIGLMRSLSTIDTRLLFTSLIASWSCVQGQAITKKNNRTWMKYSRFNSRVLPLLLTLWQGLAYLHMPQSHRYFSRYRFSSLRWNHLRPYQEACIQACLKSILEGKRRLGISLATGSGKTVECLFSA